VNYIFIYLANAFISPSFYTQQHSYVSLTRVFSFLKRRRCPLRHAARALGVNIDPLGGFLILKYQPFSLQSYITYLGRDATSGKFGLMMLVLLVTGRNLEWLEVGQLAEELFRFRLVDQEDLEPIQRLRN
jgi:hypothetical protein